LPAAAGKKTTIFLGINGGTAFVIDIIMTANYFYFIDNVRIFSFRLLANAWAALNI